MQCTQNMEPKRCSEFHNSWNNARCEINLNSLFMADARCEFFEYFGPNFSEIVEFCRALRADPTS